MNQSLQAFLMTSNTLTQITQALSTGQNVGLDSIGHATDVVPSVDLRLRSNEHLSASLKVIV